MTATPTPLRELRNFREETFAEARQQLVNVLKAQKSWLTGYAEAYVDDFVDLARAALSARDEAGAVVCAYDGLCPCCGEIECEEPATPPAASGDDSHAFKNFHRLLCERFDYGHDEVDWRRDQISLIEHIARHLAAVAPAGMGGWQPIAEAVLLPRGSDGCTGPCAVLLKIDTGRPGPFIRQGRFDVCAGGFICDSTGQVLRDAIAFIRPKFGTPPATAGEE